jgi:hypothetical protein
MLTWLRSIANAILGKVPGKPDRLDTATLMVMHAVFSDRGESYAAGAPSRVLKVFTSKFVGRSAERTTWSWILVGNQRCKF